MVKDNLADNCCDCVSPDCARKMLEGCSSECQKVAKTLPKIQTVAPKFLHIFVQTLIKSFHFRSS